MEKSKLITLNGKAKEIVADNCVHLYFDELVSDYLDDENEEELT